MRRFHTANRGNPYSPYRALALMTLRLAVCSPNWSHSIDPQSEGARLRSYSVVNKSAVVPDILLSTGAMDKSESIANVEAHIAIFILPHNKNLARARAKPASSIRYRFPHLFSALIREGRDRIVSSSCRATKPRAARAKLRDVVVALSLIS